MKQCSICKETKARSEFNKKTSRRDGLQPHCRECSHKRFKAYYYINRDYHLAEVRKVKKAQIKYLRTLVWNHLLQNPCIDCGEDDPIVLEFDHVRGKKRKEVTRLVTGGYAEEVVLEEIAKCEIRCANCHRRRTYKQTNSYRVQSSTG